MKFFKYFLLVMLVAFPFVLCQAQTKKAVANLSKPVVEVLYFHGSQRCKTCVALEKATKELIATQFADKVKSGSVKFREVNLSTKEGEKLGDKYEIAWSSLIIVRKQGKKEKYVDLTNAGFRYAVNDKAKIQTLIKNQINEFLK